MAALSRAPALLGEGAPPPLLAAPPAEAPGPRLCTRLGILVPKGPSGFYKHIHSEGKTASPIGSISAPRSDGL